MTVLVLQTFAVQDNALRRLIRFAQRLAASVGRRLDESAPFVSLLDPANALRKVGSAGKPPLFVDIRIVRPDGAACEPNETGELLVSGPNVMAGYWDRADATGDAFRKGLYDPIVEACLSLAGK